MAGEPGVTQRARGPAVTLRLADEDRPLRRDPAADREYVRALDVALEAVALDASVATPAPVERAAIDERLELGGSMRVPPASEESAGRGVR